jgi:hypothetical protein
MIKYSGHDPRMYPINGDADSVQIDRAQSLDKTATLNRTKKKEIGRTGVLGWLKGRPEISYRLTQLEHGSMEMWETLANLPTSTVTVTMHGGNFDTSWFDIASFCTDPDGTFLGTELYPGMRLSGFGINATSPEGEVERTFDFVGEAMRSLQVNNAYYIDLRKDVTSGDLNSLNSVDIVIGSGSYANWPAPVADPTVAVGASDAKKYLYRVVRVRSGVSTLLTETTDYTYTTGSTTITVLNCLDSDIIKVYYTATTYISGSTPWTDNDSDVVVTETHSIDLYLYIPQSGKPASSDYLYKIQSASIDVTLDRADYGEIGNKDIILRGVNEYTVTVTLDSYWHDFVIETVMDGVASTYGVVDVDNFQTDIALIMKIYTDDTKGTFSMGYKVTNLSPTEVRGATAIDEYEKRNYTLEGEELIITSSAGALGI